MYFSLCFKISPGHKSEEKPQSGGIWNMFDQLPRLFKFKFKFVF